MAKKEAPKLTDVMEAFAVAIAKANSHPSPLDYAAKVKAEFEAGADADPVSQEPEEAKD